MISLVPVLWPELLLILTACALFLLGLSKSAGSRRLAPVIAVAVLGVIFLTLLLRPMQEPDVDQWRTLRVFHFAEYIKMIVAGVSILLVLLAWPTGPNATGNSALEFGGDAGEFFALMLLSIAGVFLVAGANDIILLFLGIELASIPTYIMVSISRPLPVAQEAGVKYFFLGAMAAAIMLFGFSYLYGTTGRTQLDAIMSLWHPRGAGTMAELTSWQTLAVLMLLAGFAFKVAAVPLHEYAGDVYQGAATPVTAFLAFIPKTSGMVAIIKLLYMVAGPKWASPEMLMKLMWMLAVLTMTVGNVLGLLQVNIKRVLAYSSVAHTGYMFVGLTSLLAAQGNPEVQKRALLGVLFYIAAYGIMNAGVFGVLMLLPARGATRYGGAGAVRELPPTAGSAETYEDLAGQGRRHVALGLAMAVCCFSLTGLPLTIGFLGKVLLVEPALTLANSVDHDISHRMGWLVVITMVNAAISAGYYLKIVGTMFLRPEPSTASAGPATEPMPWGMAMPMVLSVLLSVAGTLVFGFVIPTTNGLTARVAQATQIDQPQRTGGSTPFRMRGPIAPPPSADAR